MSPANEPKQSKKLTQFLEELNALTEKYQYDLVPQISYTDQGAFPRIKVIDKVPPKGNVKEEPPAKPDEPIKITPIKAEE